jgi:hypothetical protein
MILKTSLLTSTRTTMILVFALFCVIGHVSAGGMLCRSDPIVDLTDGTRLQFNIEVQTAVENIIAIHYELHVPMGVDIDKITFTPNWARAKETVDLIADQPAGHYQILTFVQTEGPAVATTVKAMMVTRKNQGTGSTHKAASGISGQAIRITF